MPKLVEKDVGGIGYGMMGKLWFQYEFLRRH